MNINHRLFGTAAFALALMSGASAVAEESPYAIGGEVSKILTADGKYEIYIHTFTNTDEATAFKNVGNRTLSLRYLVVGAGGAGGCGSKDSAGKTNPSGGGGGGGGVFETQGVSFAPGTSWSVLVGKGAIANKKVADPATAAGASSISSGAEKVVEVPGGGNGAKASTSTSSVVAATDGAAGGGATSYAATAGSGTYASSILGESPAGAPFTGGSGGNYTGGGGGGAGAAGTGYTTGRAGDGGEGLASDITGESLVYGSGGGGGANPYCGRTGGLGGTRAGNGATYEIVGATTNFIAATSPAANSGCGGAGGTLDSVCRASSAGADGVVVIRYQVSIAPCEGGDIVTKTLVRGTRYAYVHIFTNTAATAEFVNGSDRELSLRYLVVGGGGAGANGTGGACGGAGGGGGGVVEAKGLTLGNAESLTIAVGKGAAKIDASNLDPVAGASTLSQGDTVIVSSPGGGNAGYYNSTASNRRAATGGANGGGGIRLNAEGATGTFVNSINGVAYGPFTGGDFYSNSRVGGSGAGAGENGKTTTSRDQAKNGGEGLASDITGETLVYGSGGGVGEAFFDVTERFPGCQGSDGGTRAGNGAKHDFTFTDNGDGSITTNWNYIAATAPAANSGAGGAGGALGKMNSDFRAGTGGADGIVVIRYEYDPTPKGLTILFR